MPITRTPMVDDDGSGTTGTIINNAWKQELYGQIDAYVGAVGAWVDVPYAASNFSASSGTWTVDSTDVLTYGYARVGNLLVMLVDLTATALSAPSAFLRIATPFQPLRSGGAIGWSTSVPGWGGVRFRLIAGDPYLYVYRLDGTNWSAGAIDLSGQVILRV